MYQIRKKTPQGSWENGCAVFDNDSGNAVTSYEFIGDNAGASPVRNHLRIPLSLQKLVLLRHRLTRSLVSRCRGQERVRCGRRWANDASVRLCTGRPECVRPSGRR